nr:ISNCY family transposase [Reticulibacter mediterranei]
MTKLDGGYCLHLVVRRCQRRTCPRYHQPYRPEMEGSWALPHGEFGLDVIALIGALRFRDHRSVPEIHQHLLSRGLRIAERTVLNLLQRYEELVAVRLADAKRLTQLLEQQGSVILAIDGLQPDVGHEVLWIIRDCLSEEILLARPLLSSTGGDIVMLLREVENQLPVPVRAIISDGQETIREAVAFVFPDIAHQLCQFHYLRDAAMPIFEADRHAKTVLKKHVRGIRPIERALEARTDGEAEAIRDYCLAVRSALTDDGHPPLCADGLRLHDRLQQIHDSIQRVEKKGALPPSLHELYRLLKRGLQKTEVLWAPIEQAYHWVHRAVHILNNHENGSATQVRVQYDALLQEMADHKATVGSLASAIEQFLKVTASFAPGLFHCYDLADLPRTNNDLEQCFGAVRHHERRATGRRGAIPGLVVRGSVRVVAALATRLHHYTAEELCLWDYHLWRQVRERLTYREEARRRQFRFRKDPLVYLAQIEARLLQT